MRIKSVKTERIVNAQKIEIILDKYIKRIDENSILAITSKIVSICEGSVVDSKEVDKEKLVYREADLFLSGKNKFGAILTIKNNVLIPTAGIDESNGNGKYILWPKNPQKSANQIRKYLRQKFKVKNVGVLITDSKTTPLRWGTTGIAIASSGFEALNSYIGNTDIFGRKMIATKANIADGLAACAVLVMGEGSEQTPLALIAEIPFVKFKDLNPTAKELSELPINLKDDLYGKILTAVKWKR
jgi:putative folate metabolism gamma-glutamate ligase